MPADIKAAGKLVIGTDSTYAPNEFLDADGKTVIGFDVDLFNAVGRQAGPEDRVADGRVRRDHPGRQQPEVQRRRLVVHDQPGADEGGQHGLLLLSAGTQWAAKAGASIAPDDACGKKIAVQTATVQVDDITARSKKCTDAGKAKITIDQYQAQSDATNAVVTGKDDAMLADSPICAYAVKQTNGQLALFGDIYDSAPYGYVLPKDQADTMGAAIKGALQALIADGTYKTILDKWGVAAGAHHRPRGEPGGLTGPDDRRHETGRARPETIRAVPVRRPGRWVAIAVLAVLAAMFAAPAADQRPVPVEFRLH